MKRYRYDFTTKLEFSAPVTEHYFTLRCLPYGGGGQRLLSGSVTAEPWCPLCYASDGFGNTLFSGSFRLSHSGLTYQGTGRVVIDHAARLREHPHPMYSHPGLLTRPDEALAAFAGSIPSDDPERLAAEVSAHFSYTPGATEVRTTAAESFRLGKGVCQDYAEVLVTLCRLKGIPARYCMGITEGTGVTHAWAEANVDGEWLGLDPTRSCRADERYLCFAVGRDAMDCPVERGLFRGNADQLKTIYAVMQEE